MEHGGDIVEADERGLAGRRLGEVGDVVDDRLGAEELRLLDEIAHPGAALLVVALEVVEIGEAQLRAVLVEHFKDAHIGLIDRNVVAFLEGHAVELVRGVEHAVLEHIVEFEIGFDLVFVEIVFRLANLLGVVLPVPWLQIEMLAVACRSSAWITSGFAPLFRRRGRDRAGR